MITRSVLILITSASVAVAQKTESSSVCWRPRALANCKNWIITEAAVEMPFASTSATHLLVGYPGGEGYTTDDFSARLAFTIGVMKNRGPATALGGTIAMTSGDLPGRLEARYRRWLGPSSGLDVSAGVAKARVRGAYDPDEASARGFTGSVGISGTYLGADARMDLMRTSNGRTISAAYVTARTGSKAGPIVTVTAFALFLGLLYLAFSGEET